MPSRIIISISSLTHCCWNTPEDDLHWTVNFYKQWIVFCMTAFQSQVCTLLLAFPTLLWVLNSTISQLLQPQMPLVIPSPALPARSRFRRRAAVLKAHTAALLEALYKNQGLLSGNFPKLLKGSVHFLKPLQCHPFQTPEQDLNPPAP